MKIESKELRKRLRSLGTIANSRYPWLNYGGCCVFAAAVAGELQRLKVEHEVIVPNDGVPVHEARENVENPANKESWNNVGIDFNHVGVRLKIDGRWHTYDSDGLVRAKNLFGGGDGGRAYRAAEGGMTAKEAKALADEAKGWNRTFSRSDVPGVRKLVREMMRAPL